MKTSHLTATRWVEKITRITWHIFFPVLVMYTFTPIGIRGLHRNGVWVRHACVRTQAHWHVCVCQCDCVCACSCVCACVTVCVCVHACMCACVSVCEQNKLAEVSTTYLRVCVCVCARVCARACVAYTLAYSRQYPRSHSGVLYQCTQTCTLTYTHTTHQHTSILIPFLDSEPPTGLKL